jgi:hypothetical protein
MNWSVLVYEENKIRFRFVFRYCITGGGAIDLLALITNDILLFAILTGYR